MSTPDPTGRPGSPPRQDLGDPLPRSLLDEPLEYILAEHYRHRCLLALLHRMAEAGTCTRSEAKQVISVIENDLALHHQDEEEDLFPLLRKRADRSDELGPVLQRLVEDHRKSRPVLRTILRGLVAAEGEAPLHLDASIRKAMAAYARSEHRHLAIENGIVLVIARERLARRDIRLISQSMKQRRGITRS